MDQKKLKKQLFQELKGLGLHDDLKKQVRMQLCEKLKTRELIKKSQSHDDKLYNRIMASLMSEELIMTDCGFTNSVYCAESGYEQKILQRSQMLELLNMNNQDLNDKISILSNLLKRKYPFNHSTLRSITVQTSPQQIGYTLQQRLALIDQEFRKNVTKTTGVINTSDQKQKFNKLEAELKKAYERDLQRFKQFEAHSIKMKISQQWTSKFQDYSKNLQETYSRKLDSLRKRERALEEDLINRNKVFDEKSFGMTKMLRQKVELLDIKNETVQETMNNLQMERKRTKQEHQLQKNQLKKKIKQYDDLLLQLNKKIEYEVGIVKLALQEEQQDKQMQFYSRKKFIDEEYGKIIGIKQSCDVIQEENRRLFDENARLRKDLTHIEEQLRISVSQNGSKGDRIEDLKSQINEQKQKIQTVSKNQQQQTKKRKNQEKTILQLRKQIQQLRTFKQKYDQQHPSKCSSSPHNQNINLNSQYGKKLQMIKQQRKKDIERLRMDL